MIHPNVCLIKIHTFLHSSVYIMILILGKISISKETYLYYDGQYYYNFGCVLFATRVHCGSSDNTLTTLELFCVVTKNCIIK